MATQGLVTIRSKSDGKVLAKIVAGQGGHKATKLADILQRYWPMDVWSIYKEAEELGFGCYDCLAVLTATDVFCDQSRNLDQYPNYQATFEQPEFNPRWGKGTADYVVVIDI